MVIDLGLIDCITYEINARIDKSLSIMRQSKHTFILRYESTLVWQ
jgi:hypothetical protein